MLLLVAIGLAAVTNAGFAQGTAFTYQGRLYDRTNPANGTFDMAFGLWNAPANGTENAGPLTISGIGVTNGLFTVTIDFGSGVWNGATNWLQIAVATNGGSFTVLSPRQQLTPTPYAIMANSASNLLGVLPAAKLTGTVGNGQLANSSITVNAGAGLSGGGTVPLGGATTLNNAGVTSLAAVGGLTVSASTGAVTLGITGTNGNAPNAIVSRDANGGISAGSLTLGGGLSLPFPAILTSGGTSLLVDGGSLYVGLSPSNAVFNTIPLFNAGFGDNALAYEATSTNASGAFNTAIGEYALMENISGSQNTAVGEEALFLNTVGYGNTAVGAEALYDNAGGSYNTADGLQALANNYSGSNNTAVGFYALVSNTNGAYNTAIGAQALYGNTDGAYNTAGGFQALANNTSGSQSTALGYQALVNNTNGGDNTALGFAALWNNVAGSYNTASGVAALLQNASGSNNTAVGFQALGNATDNSNIALGYMAGYDLTDGVQNIYIGNLGAGGDNGTVRLGTQNTQTHTYIAGIYGETVSNALQVYVDSAGQLGAFPPEPGPMGPPGPQGPAGPVGPQGPQGPAGPVGPAGATGTAGPQGAQGPVGPAGLNWRSAWADSASYAVDDAVSWSNSSWVATQANSGQPPAVGSSYWSLLAQQGAQGPAGATGATGTTGAQGPPGAQGLQGPQGPLGPAGPIGPMGATGVQGPPGPTGATGTTGAQGPQGPAGAAGLNWRNAWDGSASYAPNDAVSWSNSSWVATQVNSGQAPGLGSSYWSLLALEGAQGPAGATGATGATGPAGPAGPAGPTGPTGATGPQGPAGTIASNSVTSVDLAADTASLGKITGGLTEDASQNFYLNDHVLQLRNDQYHGVGFYSTFGGTGVNGPVLFGFDGGALGLNHFGQSITLAWDINSVHINGSAYCTSGAWSGSDARWKKNVQPLTDALDKVTHLQGVSYEWRRDEFPDKHFDAGTQLGFIAQDVEKVLPAAVRTDAQGYKSIAYGKLTAVLNEAIKEQQTEIDSLKTQNAELEKGVAELNALVNKLLAK